MAYAFLAYAWDVGDTGLVTMDADHFPGRDLTPAEKLWLDAVLAGRTLDHQIAKRSGLRSGR
jgi:hypothetical protein